MFLFFGNNYRFISEPFFGIFLFFWNKHRLRSEPFFFLRINIGSEADFFVS